MFILLLLSSCRGEAKDFGWVNTTQQSIPIKEVRGVKLLSFGEPTNEFMELSQKHLQMEMIADTTTIQPSDFIIVLASQPQFDTTLTWLSERDIDSSRLVIALTFSPNKEQKQRLSRWECISVTNSNPEQRQLLAGVIFGTKPLLGVSDRAIRVDFDTVTNCEVEMNLEYLESTIDSLIAEAMGENAFPGCQVLVARRNHVVFNKNYGYHTYAKQTKVRSDDIFDVASCTKILAATLALMKVVEEEKLSLDEPISKAFKWFKNSDKEEITLREFLAHQGGLVPAISIRELITNGRRGLKSGWFTTTRDKDHTIEIHPRMWGKSSLPTEVYRAAAETELKSKESRYSCVSFLCYPEVIKNITGRDYETLLDEEFYSPLGITHTMYKPAHKYPLNKILPTEQDKRYRNTLIHGYVHDESAAMLGGISGNAGLFSNAEDIVKIMQMLLNGGTYGGKQYLQAETIKEWTSVQYPENNNRRGLGFDRPKADITLWILRRHTPHRQPHKRASGTLVSQEPWCGQTLNMRSSTYSSAIEYTPNEALPWRV